MEKIIEIPEGYEARIDGNKVILESKESEDERIKKAIKSLIIASEKNGTIDGVIKEHDALVWLEKKGEKEYVLKSSKDEDVHKFVQYIERQAKAYELNLPNRSYDIYGFAKDILSWLEKQGEQKKKQYQIYESTEPKSSVLPKYEIGDVIRLKNSDQEFIINRITDGYYHSKGAYIQIRIADDVNGDWEYVRHIQPKPKFNVGDTIIAKAETCMEHVPFHITSIEDGFYWDGDDSILIDNQDDFVRVGKTVKEPAHKFNLGDWIVRDSDGFTTSIKNVKDEIYYLYQGGNLFVKDVDECFHLWTIEDAKDGDVLTEHETIVLFKEIDGLNIRCYCTYHYLGYNPDLRVDTLQNKKPYYPATEEERNLLFQKIKESGYEWNAEKKELKKIEQKPSTSVAEFDTEVEKFCKESFIKDTNEKGKVFCIARHFADWQKHRQNTVWSEEDEQEFNVMKSELEKYIMLKQYGTPLSVNDIEWFKSLKNRVQPQTKPVWSEEDERTLNSILNDLSQDVIPDEEDIQWLKSLKERVQPQSKQEWSEKDEKMLASFLHKLEVCTLLTNKEYQWADNKLKSLKERYTWKPSDEQMEYLAKAITTLGNEGDNKTSAILCELRTCLKKLNG